MIKNRKSCSVVDVTPAGAEAVTALKLAVFVLTNPVDIFTYCFLKYVEVSAPPVIELSVYVLAAFSVTNAVVLESVSDSELLPQAKPAINKIAKAVNIIILVLWYVISTN